MIYWILKLLTFLVLIVFSKWERLLNKEEISINYILEMYGWREDGVRWIVEMKLSYFECFIVFWRKGKENYEKEFWYKNGCLFVFL